MALPLPAQLGPFELLRHLASGGMGDVYLAHGPAERAQALCVVKTVRPEYAHDKAALRRFVDEARTSALLAHPNVVTVLDVGESGGTAYIAVEYVAGRDLMAVMVKASRARRTLPETVALYIVTELLDALDYVHHARDPRSGVELRVVHRDVSPHNLLVGFDGAVKLIDFGIARTSLKGDLTGVGQLVGKIRYMSPEQARGEAVDGATDVWAASVVACELLTGRRYWGERSPEQVAPMLVAGAPHRPPGFDSLAPELQRWLGRALEQDPGARPRAAELRDALRAAQARRQTLGSAGETAALLDVLFAGERAHEEAARARLLEEPTVATAAALPEVTAYEEGSAGGGGGADETASRSGALTRSMTPLKPLAPTRPARSATRGERAVSRRGPSVTTLVAAGAASVAVLAFALALVPRDDDPVAVAAPAPRPAAVLPPPEPPVATPPSTVPPAAVPPAAVPPAAAPPAAAPPAAVPPAAVPPAAVPPAAVPPATVPPASEGPAPVERRPPRKGPRAPAMPLLFSDRVLALRACSPRPACAAGVLRRADDVAELDVEELRELDDTLARCLSRCAR